jgi:small subunit ribosomal protein S15
MARMHARVKGKSGSKKPLESKVPKWVEKKPKEIVTLVEKLSKKEMSSSQIGLALRDSYGVPSVKLMTGKSILQILTSAKLTGTIPEDLKNLIKKAITIRKHLKLNRKDNFSTRGLQLTEAKIRRLQKYYKREGVLPADWNYNPDRAELLVD